MLVAFDKQRGDMDAALEAVEEAFHAVCVTIAQHRLLQRQPRVSRIGDKGFPTQALAVRSDDVFLTCDLCDVVTGSLDHALLAMHSASPSPHVVGGLLDLLVPGDAEQPVHPMRGEHAGNRLQECRFIGDLTFPRPSGGREGRQLGLRMAQTFFSPRGLLGGMYGGAHDQHPFAPGPYAVRRMAGPLNLIALGRKSLVPAVIGAPYPG